MNKNEFFQIIKMHGWLVGQVMLAVLGIIAFGIALTLSLWVFIVLAGLFALTVIGVLTYSILSVLLGRRPRSSETVHYEVLEIKDINDKE